MRSRIVQMIRSIMGHSRARETSIGFEDLEPGDLSPEEFVRLSYLVLLRRKIDPVGLANWRDAISRGMFAQSSVVDGLLGSEEYQRQFGMDVNRRLHEARMAWIAELPAFDRLLDIGGSNPMHAEGALIRLGYPHRPRQLDILDLPPDRQNHGTPIHDQSIPAMFEWGTVSYFHGSAEDIAKVAALQQRTYDCVFMGQAIEHVRPEALPAILQWIHAHLAPNGCFIADTPNRILTRIQCPSWYIHPDHKIEYEPDQLARVLADNGFKVVKRVGMAHLPKIAAGGIYDAREFRDAQLLHENADACYLFALEAVAD